MYRADGVKVRKVFGTETTDYLDGFQYTNSILKFFPTAEGYFNVETGKYVYNYTDHLGNTRLSYAKNGLGTEIIEENNYYPFGLKHEGYNTLLGNSAYQYKYNGKELQETGMYDYGARMYMPDLGRWGVVDPLAEKYFSMSPYNYVGNNPAIFVDFNGKDFGVRINHATKTIIIEANYYYQNQTTLDNNQAARNSWNNLTGTYTTADGIEYAVAFNLQGSLTTGDQTVQAAAEVDPIGNSVQELSDAGYNNWATAKAGEIRANEHKDNGGGGMTANKKNIANKASVANTETRAHEKGHTLGLGENEGGVMDYAESLSSMSLPNGTNLQRVLTGAMNKATTPSTLNTEGSKATNTASAPNVIINVSGTYTGTGNFTDHRIEPIIEKSR